MNNGQIRIVKLLQFIYQSIGCIAWNKIIDHCVIGHREIPSLQKKKKWLYRTDLIDLPDNKGDALARSYSSCSSLNLANTVW